jgi:hypothetical protein
MVNAGGIRPFIKNSPIQQFTIHYSVASPGDATVIRALEIGA